MSFTFLLYMHSEYHLHIDNNLDQSRLDLLKSRKCVDTVYLKLLQNALKGTNFCYLSNYVLCVPKPVDRKIILPRVITLPHFPLSD